MEVKPGNALWHQVVEELTALLLNLSANNRKL